MTAEQDGPMSEDAPWTPLMDVVHTLIEDTGADCPEDGDNEPLCMTIAVGLWLEGWRPPAQSEANAAIAVLAGVRAEMTEKFERYLDGNLRGHALGMSKAIALVEATEQRLARESSS